jgi:hydrogenase expression/formation protein HypE
MTTEQEVLQRIERARRRGPRLLETRVTLPHGAGGKASQALIDNVFVDAFRNEVLTELADAAAVTIAGVPLALSTDSFVVSPLFFPGGDIGELAVNGTVNDLAVSGARPCYLSAGFILEEGFPIEDLRRIATSMARAAARAGVRIVAGDTKVVERGKADGCYITTTGVGLLDPTRRLGGRHVRAGDVVLVSGPIGEHGVTIMLARSELGITADIRSDTAPLHLATAALLEAAPGVRVMRDATRGGVATVLNELAQDAQVAVVIDESAVPVQPAVTGTCELLGIDPLYVACEGRFVAIIDPADAEPAIAALRTAPGGEGATIIGEVRADPPGLVQARTGFGGTRIVDMLVGDPLPRIC